MGSRSIHGIVTLAGATHDIVTTADLVAAGLDPAVAERQVRARNWQRPARGVYVTSDRCLTGLDLGRSAVRLAGTRVVISGLVVLRELGLRWLPESDQLAPVHRAVVDAAWETSTLRDVRGIVLGAVADSWSAPEDLDRALATTQRNGSGLTRRAIEDARRGAASPPEAELVDELLGCGEPFYVNPDLFLDGRFLGSPDVYLPGLGLGGEVDSRERHESDDDVESTYDRHERITSATGIELVHLSVRRIRRDVTEAVRHLLSRVPERRRRARPEPPGLVVVPRGPLLSWAGGARPRGPARRTSGRRCGAGRPGWRTRW